MGLNVSGVSLPRDGDANPVQVQTQIRTADISSTPKKSPLAVAGTILEIIPPLDAITMDIRALTDDIRFGPTSGLDAYNILLVGESKIIPVSNGESVYFVQNSGAATLNFHFNTLAGSVAST